VRLQESFDTVVCIGLLMFFDRPTARRQLAHLKSLVAPGGILAVNVLVEGTTFMEKFTPGGHHLFAPRELAAAVEGWELLLHEHSRYPAPGDRVKAFATLVARRPGD
jgi:tellurite methyltransferase